MVSRALRLMGVTPPPLLVCDHAIHTLHVASSRPCVQEPGPELSAQEFQFTEQPDAYAALCTRDRSSLWVHSPRSWPFVVFFAVAIGGPYLIWRYLISPGIGPCAMHAQTDSSRRNPEAAAGVRVETCVWGVGDVSAGTSGSRCACGQCGTLTRRLPMSSASALATPLLVYFVLFFLKDRLIHMKSLDNVLCISSSCTRPGPPIRVSGSQPSLKARKGLHSFIVDYLNLNVDLGSSRPTTYV